MRDEILKTGLFVKEKFRENPYYSFNDWHVMYNHSIIVEKLASRISRGMKCDRLLVSLGALLHDIGKTYKTDEETLHKHHEGFNLAVSIEFIEGLGLPGKKLSKLKKIVSYSSSSVEMKIVKDADALAFYYDRKLNRLFLKWAKAKELDSSIERKISKFGNLYFEESRKIGKEWLERMKKGWKVT